MIDENIVELNALPNANHVKSFGSLFYFMNEQYSIRAVLVKNKQYARKLLTGIYAVISEKTDVFLT